MEFIDPKWNRRSKPRRTRQVRRVAPATSTMTKETAVRVLCFVGPMIGKHKGRVTTQDEILANLFLSAGYGVLSISEKRGRIGRFLDTVIRVVGSIPKADLYCISVYSGPSFVITDAASWIVRRFGRPIIFHLHGGALPDMLRAYPRWVSGVLKRGDVLVAPSAYLKRDCNLRECVTRIIPNVIDTTEYPFRLREHVRPRLLWMRSFHEIWNPLMAVRVIDQLRQRGIDARLVMGGQDKGMLALVRDETKRRGIEDSVILAGFLDADGKRKYGRECDIFINTNRIDNSPVAVIEAWAMGLPVVSTDVGGIPDLVTDGVTGLLTRSDDDTAMVNKIEELLNNPELARRLSASGREKAEESSWEKIRPQWESLFAEVTDARQNRTSFCPPMMGDGE